jgi:hypothetical protein
MAVQLVDVVFQLTLGGNKGVTNSDVRVFMLFVPARIAGNDQFLPWYRHIDPYVILLALVMMSVWRLDQDTAAGDFVEQVAEF